MAETKLIKHPDSWMADMWDVIGNRPLREITLPGTHDSGVHSFSHTFPPAVVDHCNTRTQDCKIKEQLERGARCFDVRPAFWSADDRWYLAHGSVGKTGYVGAFGELFQDVLNDVRDFAKGPPKGHPKEVIILFFSHYQRIGSAFKEGTRDCNYQEKEAMLKMVTDTLKDVMIKANDFFVRLADSTPNDLVKDNRTVICLFEDMALFAAPENGIFSGGGRIATRNTPGLTVGRDGRVGFGFVPRDGPSSAMRFVSSPNGNGNWSRLDQTMHGQLAKRGPSLGRGPDGTLYAVFVADDASDTLMCVTSPDSGQSWSAGVGLNQKAHADPSLVVGKDGTLYVLYLNGKELMLTRSGDGGRSWSQGQKLEQASKMAASLAIDSQGTLYALFVANNDSNDLLLSILPKGETRWSSDQKLHQAAKMQMGPVLLIDSKDNLYAFFAANNPGNDLLLTTRPKGQTNWTPQRGIGASTRMGPVGAVDANDNLYVLYAANNDSLSLILTRSSDHGQNWGDVGVNAHNNLEVAGDYADSHEVRVVRTFEKGRLCCFRPRAGVAYGTSWTGTWHPAPAVIVDPYPCIDKMAEELNNSLQGSMEEWVRDGVITSQRRPNIVWVDYYNTGHLNTIEYLNRVLR